MVHIRNQIKKQKKTNLKQEVEIKPKVVVEVGYEEIQKSPSYGSGYALRFPRLVRVRDGKGVDDADTIERVERLIKK